MTSGAHVIAKALKKLGITTVFGIVGIPIVEVGDALIQEGVRFISFRNEQSAAYAASAYGYLTGEPGVLLVVGGPGVIHALSGVLNSNSNRWPLLVLAGSAGVDDLHKGGFQELDQMALMTPLAKFAGKIQTLDQIPSLLFKAYKDSMFGTPGTTYIDLPADIVELEDIDAKVEQQLLNQIAPLTKASIPKFIPPKSQLEQAVALLSTAKNPLIVIGKGSSFSGGANAIRRFINTHNLPFLPTPMGKGVVPDSSELNVSSARSQALRNADVVLLLGARLNWILHFGETPRWHHSVKFIQVDTNPEEIGHNNPRAVQYGLVGDIGLVTQELDSLLGSYKYSGIPESIKETIRKNNKSLEIKETAVQPQLNYNLVYKTLRDLIEPIEEDVILVTEGANTMDVARISFPQSFPRQRLDAGTNATMGIGLGYAIASKTAHKDKNVVAIQGDSAFGFSAMELETAVRSHLPIIVVVMNNSGIYRGVPDPKEYDVFEKLPSTALSKETRYDLLGQSLGCLGFMAKTQEEVDMAFREALNGLKRGESSVINVIIGPGVQKKVGFGWQNKKAKL
jgi:2-hydroxyacyl-CoA lyase 1